MITLNNTLYNTFICVKNPFIYEKKLKTEAKKKFKNVEYNAILLLFQLIYEEI